MSNLFRIETDQTHLSLSLAPRGESKAEPTRPEGRLAISLINLVNKHIEIQRAGLPDELANNLDVQVGPCLYEETPYNLLLRSTNQRPVELWHRDPNILNALNSDADGTIVHGPINFYSQIGRSCFSVYVGGKAEYSFEIEVFPTKLDYAADYNILLADIQEILAGLVLEYLRSTFKLGFAVDSQDSSRLEWILLLRHVVDDLESGLHYIERHPHHGIVREHLATRIERLRRPDATTLRMIQQGKGQGAKTRTASGLVLHSRLPERRTKTTWDTPEHRWLASQLTLIRRTLSGVHSEERKSGAQRNARGRRILEEIAQLEARIAALERLRPITHVKGSVSAGFSSLTLQAQTGYREAYRACLILLQGLRVDGGPVGLSVKEIHCLYEYWCYLTLVRLVAKILGEKMPVAELISIQQNGLQVRLKRGSSRTVKFAKGDRSLELTYNPKYSGDAFLHAQEPDVVLTLRYPGLSVLRLVFDAKYRIDTSPGHVKRYGSPGPPQTSIDALHRYRDAILEETGQQGPRSETLKRTVVEGVALFPHVDIEDRFRSSSLWLKLQSVGIGAIPFLPRETRYMEEWLRTVLRREGWETAESTIPYAPFEQLRAWEQAEKELVLICTLRRKAREHLDWIKSRRCFYIPLTPRQSAQFVARWIAIYSRLSPGKPGAVTHWAAVKSIEVKARSEIDTPWLPRGSPNEQHLVYRLGEVCKLKRPIEDSTGRGPGKRFSSNRFTTRLAIERASDLRELSLGTCMEWRLHEQLRAENVDFAVKPVTVKLSDQNERRGRVWFVRNALRVRYKGEAGFLIRETRRRDEYRSDLDEVVARLVSQD